MTSYALEILGSNVGWVLVHSEGGGEIYPEIGRSIMVGRGVINFDSSGVRHNNFRFELVTKEGSRRPTGWEGGSINCIVCHSLIFGTKHPNWELERSTFLRGCTISLKYSTCSLPLLWIAPTFSVAHARGSWMFGSHND